jgi:hypothetical protein
LYNILILKRKKEFDMKLPKILALHYGLAAILLATTLTAYATTPKKEMVEAQQQEAEGAIEAAKKAEPATEARPAAISSHKKHSVQSSKGDMIKGQKKATEQGIEDAAAAKPAVEGRPAVTTKKTLKPANEGGKHDLIKAQKKETEKAIKDAEAVNSAVDVKPAATNSN